MSVKDLDLTGKIGRPEIEIDMDKLAAFCRLKPTAEDCAAFFQCSVDTIERRIKDAFGVTFAEFREQKMVSTRFSLIRKAIEKAENGDNTMLIFALKNLCGWRDKLPEEADNVSVAVQNNVSPQFKIDLEERMKQLRESGQK